MITHSPAALPLSAAAGEFFQNSVVPIAELVRTGVINRSVQLAPEVGGWPLRDYHLQMLRAFTNHAVRTVRQLAPSCGGEGVGACARAPPRCFSRLLLCKFRDVYDGALQYDGPWSAARAIVDDLSVRRRETRRREARLARPPFVVLFASRRGAKNGARMLSNEDELLRVCARWVPPAACTPGADGADGGARRGSPMALRGTPRPARCEARVFGKRSFKADVAAVQQADVLVGTHGAALVHAIFMRAGSALIEVRPYHFDGAVRPLPRPSA